MDQRCQSVDLVPRGCYRQIRNAWSNVMRAAYFIPAVEYVQANRQRPEGFLGLVGLSGLWGYWLAPRKCVPGVLFCKAIR